MSFIGSFLTSLQGQLCIMEPVGVHTPGGVHLGKCFTHAFQIPYAIPT